MNLRGAHHADHRFRDGCLTGLGQSSRHGNGIPLSWLSRCQESNLIRRFIRALHRPPCSTSLSCAEGARFERAPGCSVPDHGLAARCLAWLGQPSKFVCPWQELNLQTRCGRAGLGRVRLPVPPQGPCCPSRVRTSVSAVRARCPCQLDQRASGVCVVGSRSRDRTWAGGSKVRRAADYTNRECGAPTRI